MDLRCDQGRRFYSAILYSGPGRGEFPSPSVWLAPLQLVTNLNTDPTWPS